MIKWWKHCDKCEHQEYDKFADIHYCQQYECKYEKLAREKRQNKQKEKLT